MIRRFVIELEDTLKGYEEDVETLERKYGAEERPKGEWESGGFCVTTTSYKCPFCKSKTLERTNFCPDCGADMRGKKNV